MVNKHKIVTELNYIFRPNKYKDLAEEYKYYCGEFIEYETGFVVLIYRGNKTKIYTPELATLLCGENITLEVQETGKPIKLNDAQQDFFAKRYIEGYLKGKDYFKDKHNLSPSTLYGANAGKAIQSLYFKCFRSDCLDTTQGWDVIKHSHLRIISAKDISEHGFYAGMLSEVEDLFKRHPFLFKEYGFCTING